MLPLELLNTFLGCRVRDTKEVKGDLIGFDDYINLVLDKVEDNEANSVQDTVMLNGTNIVSIIELRS
jgi:small nuclear ribonucleoprotein (snRNP)-like protein